MNLTRFLIRYKQTGKQHKYYVSAASVEQAERIFQLDTKDEPPAQIVQIASYGEL